MFFRKSDDPIYVPQAGPGAAEPPSQQIYAAMGDANIRKMLRDFYLELGKSKIAGMFPEDLEKASEKSALFFIGILGGPSLYMQTYGPPRMRARHLPFRITEDHRKVWLECFFKVLNEPHRYHFPDEHLSGFKKFLEGFSGWMVNSVEN